MYKIGSRIALWLLISSVLMTGCWSSKEIEEQSIYVGMAIDLEKSTPEADNSALIENVSKESNNITATIQIVPQKSVTNKKQSGNEQAKRYLNLKQSGESMFEIMRQTALRRDRQLIGHHLKVFVISSELAEQVEIDKLLDFMLRDNDIRPSCLVFLAQGKASDTMNSEQPEEVPAFHIRDLTSNRNRNNKILKRVILTDLDQYLQSKHSFILQSISTNNGEIEFDGAGIIKGKTGKWFGHLTQDDVSSISWITGDGGGGEVKAFNSKNEMALYEIITLKSKIIPKVNGDEISFHVDIQSSGRLIENWDTSSNSSHTDFLLDVEQAIEEKLNITLHSLMDKLQNEYKVDVLGFGKKLSIANPRMWSQVKEDWDEVFSSSKVTFNVNLEITGYGSSTR